MVDLISLPQVKVWLLEWQKPPFYSRRLSLDALILGVVYILADYASNFASVLSPTFIIPPLPDQIFKILPQISLLYLTDIFADSAVGFAILFGIYLAKRTLRPLVQYSECIIIAYILRSSVIFLTNLPDPRLDCQKIALDSVLTNFSSHRCGDAMFSGHTVLLTISALFFTSYIPRSRSKVFFVCFAWLWVSSGVLILLLNRTHYTSDVLIGFYICQGVWWTWSYFNSINFRKKSSRDLSISDSIDKSRKEIRIDPSISEICRSEFV